MERIKQMLEHYYNIKITAIQSQQGGWASLAYKVWNENQQYFLKVYEKSRASTPKLMERIDEYVPIMDWLYRNSELKESISVPILTREGNYKWEDDEGVYLLYEFIEGTTIGDRMLTDKQIQQFSEIITNLHGYGEEIPVTTDSIKETFSVPYIQFYQDILNSNYTHMASDIRKVVSQYKTHIHDLISTVENLAESLHDSDLRMALCHADLHYWNLMESHDQLVLIDWEGLKLAPVEADFMFLVDKPYFNRFIAIYQEKHHNFELNREALHFYQGRRKLEDIGEFLEQLMLDTLSEQERISTMNYLKEELRSISR
ncbi:aminoglycoside phosphotransferase family protein [Gracilibacillus sp. HCP3S3_G5_1]|uniref:aminoglycoside phosphotransferase family protein n=1 Tax=unclassified Gracilibacillus TaxID=2625209 RepID=UPI003F8AB539